MRAIDKGLANSRIGIVLVTPALLRSLPAEGIADNELSELLARERLVSIVHGTTYEVLREVSPMLAPRTGLSTKEDPRPPALPSSKSSSPSRTPLPAQAPTKSSLLCAALRGRLNSEGVKVINLPGTRERYGEILAATFKELREYMRDNVVSVSKVTEEEPLRELLLPRDASTRLCFFSLPLE